VVAGHAVDAIGRGGCLQKRHASVLSVSVLVGYT
jgi:hypothetical protein